MKKIVCYLLLGALLILTLGCTKSKSDDLRERPDVVGKVPFKICLQTSPQTRTLNNGMSTQWVIGDEVNVFHVISGGTDYVNDGKFTITDVDNGVFEGMLASELDNNLSYEWFVSYPYSSELTSPSNTVSGYLTVAPINQTQVGNDSKSHLAGLALVGHCETNAGISTPSVLMKQTASVLKIVVTNKSGSNLPVSCVKITTAADTELQGHQSINITGDYFVQFTDPDNWVYHASSKVSNVATLNTSYTIPESEKGIFYVVVNPFTILQGDVLKVRINNFEKSIDISSDLTFAASEINTITFYYNQPWVDVNDVIAAGLPVLYVETVDLEEPTYEVATAPDNMAGVGIRNATKVPGRVYIEDGGNIVYDSGNYVEKKSGMTIKVRGNTTASGSVHSKKPYKIKLQKKADLLNRGDSKYEDKNWILIKDEALRSKIGFKVNELMGLQWTPSYMYVNVIFNGEYRGLYMLLESVERNTDCRLNVKKTGYIIELDPYWWNEDRYFTSSFNAKMQYTYKYPDTDDLTDEQNTYIQGYVNAAETSLQDGSYSDYIDVDSFASWMLGHDILGNTDGLGSNWYFTKYDNTTSSKLMMGPLWDFDAIMRSTTWDYAHMNYWFGALFANTNKSFVTLYKEKWSALKSTLFSELESYLESFSQSAVGTAFDNSLVLDNARWNKENSSVSQRVEDAIAWFEARYAWLDNHIPALNDQN